jgi:hypothetical protein
LKQGKTKIIHPPNPIPPLSVVRLVTADHKTPGWRKDKGRTFRVGYYSRQDGLDCIWLVNDEGKYEQTTNHEYLYRYFDVIHFAEHTNWYGRRRPCINSIRLADANSKGKQKWDGSRRFPPCLENFR